jgi:hypothetical protein
MASQRITSRMGVTCGAETRSSLKWILEPCWTLSKSTVQLIEPSSGTPEQRFYQSRELVTDGVGIGHELSMIRELESWKRAVRLGAAVTSFSLLAFWSATTSSAAECEKIPSDEQFSDTEQPTPSPRASNQSVKASNSSWKNSPPPFDLHVDRDSSRVPADVLWSRYPQTEASASVLTNNVNSPASQPLDPPTATTAEKNEVAQMREALARVNAANVNSTAITASQPLDPPLSTKSESPPWGDEVAHARGGLAKRLVNLEPGNTKAIPWPIISKKGQQVAVRFRLAPSTDFSHFLADAISRLGSDPQEGAPSSGPLVRVQAYDR